MKLLWKLGVVCGLILVAVGIYLWDPLPANPDAKTLSAGASKYHVEIIRDDWGVPHIYGKTDADTAFGVGYAHSEDDFETILQSVAAVRGVMARYQGKGAATTDYLVNFMGVWETVNQGYDDKIPDDVRAIAEAYAAGLNLYAAQHPDKAWKGLMPVTGKDVVAGFVFKTPLFYGLDTTLLELFGDERKQEIALDPSEGRQAWHVGPKTMAERGSNGMAVAPKRSGDNSTRLLINSHQPFTGPVAWYEAHTISEQGPNIYGALFPGTPIILHGFNQNLGWANTVSGPDLADVYLLTLNPNNKKQYKLDGQWHEFERTTAYIKVKLFGPFAFKAKRKILSTKHGPVIETSHGDYAVRYAGMGEIRQLEQFYRQTRAQSLAEFENAIKINAISSFNYVYADKQGNVGFIHNGQYPNRKKGWNWGKYLPGDRSDLIWQGYRPYSDIPKLFNPQSGFIYNSNNTPFSATDGPDNLSQDDFASSMGLQANYTNRALRVMELTNGKSPIGKAELLALKFDTKYSANSEAAEVVAAVLTYDWSAEPEMEKAIEHLRAWDFDMAVESRHAALGGLTVLAKITEPFTHKPSPTPSDAFRNAVNLLMQTHGRIDPKWGEVNRLIRGNIDIPIDGGADILRAIYPKEFRKDGRLHANAGDTWVSLTQWGSDGTLSADVIHQFGSATLNEASPHYSDQAEMFANHQWRKAHLTRDDILAHAERIYAPTNN